MKMKYKTEPVRNTSPNDSVYCVEMYHRVIIRPGHSCIKNRSQWFGGALPWPIVPMGVLYGGTPNRPKDSHIRTLPLTTTALGLEASTIPSLSSGAAGNHPSCSLLSTYPRTGSQSPPAGCPRSLRCGCENGGKKY